MIRIINLKTLFLFVCLIGTTNYALAQSQIKDSSKVYNYWAQRGIVEIVYAYMNDYIETVGVQRASTENEGMVLFKDKFIDILKNDSLPKFQDISSFLNKNGWTNVEKKLLQPLKMNFENNINLDANFFEVKKPGSEDLITDIPGYTNKRTNWNSTQNIILSNYSKELKKIEKGNKNLAAVQKKDSLNNQKEIDPTGITNENVDDSSMDWSKWLWYFAILLIGFVSGGFLVFLISNYKAQAILGDDIDTYLHDMRLDKQKFKFKYIGLLHFLNERNKELEKAHSEKRYKNRELEDTNALLREQNEKYKRELSQKKEINHLKKESTFDDDRLTQTYSWNTIDKPQYEKQKLFFTMPDNEGRFLVDHGEPSNDGRKYFRIEFLENSESGELFFISGERDKRAINRLESYLKPVCEIENINDAESANQIDIISNGKVNLVNDSWVIDTDRKIKIKLL